MAHIYTFCAAWEIVETLKAQIFPLVPLLSIFHPFTVTISISSEISVDNDHHSCFITIRAFGYSQFN